MISESHAQLPASDRRVLAAGALLLCLIATCPAGADDGSISWGGTPRLLKGHRWVTMRSEVVRMTVGEQTIRVDCRFAFENHGPACSVRMGFPDNGEGGGYDEDDAHDREAHRPPHGTFRYFRSYVDGARVRTRVVRAGQDGHFWHVKTVRFPAHGRRVVRDVYEEAVGEQLHLTRNDAAVHQAAYTLRTGSSWRGRIGRAEVIVTFRRRRMRGPLAPAREAPMVRQQYAEDWSRIRGRVYYAGPCKPSTHGLTMRFVRANWRPTEQDDIYLFFDCTHDPFEGEPWIRRSRRRIAALPASAGTRLKRVAWLTQGRGAGHFAAMHADYPDAAGTDQVLRDSHGRFIVVDRGQGIAQRYDPATKRWRVVARGLDRGTVTAPVALGIDDTLLVASARHRTITRFAPDGRKRGVIHLPGGDVVWDLQSVSPDRVLLLVSPEYDSEIRHLRVTSLRDGHTIGEYEVDREKLGISPPEWKKLGPPEWSLLTNVVRGEDGRFYWPGASPIPVPGLGTIHGIVLPSIGRYWFFTLLWVGKRQYSGILNVDEDEHWLIRATRLGRTLRRTLLERLVPRGAELPIDDLQRIAACSGRDGEVYLFVSRYARRPRACEIATITRYAGSGSARRAGQARR